MSTDCTDICLISVKMTACVLLSYVLHETNFVVLFLSLPFCNGYAMYYSFIRRLNLPRHKPNILCASQAMCVFDSNEVLLGFQDLRIKNSGWYNIG